MDNQRPETTTTTRSVETINLDGWLAIFPRFMEGFVRSGLEVTVNTEKKSGKVILKELRQAQLIQMEGKKPAFMILLSLKTGETKVFQNFQNDFRFVDYQGNVTEVTKVRFENAKKLNMYNDYVIDLLQTLTRSGIRINYVKEQRKPEKQTSTKEVASMTSLSRQVASNNLVENLVNR